MKRNSFLNKLKKEGKLELIDPSEEIEASYTGKSNNCLRSAKLLLNNDLYENSIGMSYYAMYNSLLSLLFKIGVKCENHGGSIFLLKFFLERSDLYDIISNAKSERIDKQYYVTTERDETTKEIANDLLKDAEDFVLKIKVFAGSLSNDKVNEFREEFRDSVD